MVIHIDDVVIITNTIKKSIYLISQNWNILISLIAKLASFLVVTISDDGITYIDRITTLINCQV